MNNKIKPWIDYVLSNFSGTLNEKLTLSCYRQVNFSRNIRKKLKTLTWKKSNISISQN